MDKEKQIEALNKDFENKINIYFDKSYREKDFRNWLRCERCGLINKWLDGIERIDQVVDVGCGPSILYEKTLARCETYLAIDVVAANLNNICIYSDKIKPAHADLDSYTWHFEVPPSVVISQGCLEYTEQPLHIAKRIISSLDKDGIFIASFPNKFNPLRLWLEYVHLPVKYTLMSILGHKLYYRRKLFSASEVISEIEAAGATIIESEWIGFIFLPHYVQQFFPKISYYLAKWFENHMPFLKIFATEFIIYTQKK